MSATAFLDALGGARSLHRVIYYPVTDSTNTRAIDAFARGAARAGDIFIAGRQTAGRGTGGKLWISGEPTGLWLTILLADPPPARPLYLLPAIALARVLRAHYGVMAHLKWPNDVLVGSGDATRKIAGILTESCQCPSARAWAVGIGVNLNQQRFDHPLDRIATSLRLQSGREISIARFFGRLMTDLRSLYDGTCDLPTLWTELSRMPGRTVRLNRDGRGENVRIDAVDENGHLLITHSDGRRECLVGISGTDIQHRA